MADLNGSIEGATTTIVGGVTTDCVEAGRAHVKRMTYPVGWRWSKDMKPVSGTDLCNHAHVGFMVAGAITVEYPDGCRVELVAPAAVVIEPGHDSWVVGDETAVLIQIDCDVETIDRLGLEGEHRH
jgi:hypothetical protein